MRIIVNCNKAGPKSVLCTNLMTGSLQSFWKGVPCLPVHVIEAAKPFVGPMWVSHMEQLQHEIHLQTCSWFRRKSRENLEIPISLMSTSMFVCEFTQFFFFFSAKKILQPFEGQASFSHLPAMVIFSCDWNIHQPKQCIGVAWMQNPGVSKALTPMPWPSDPTSLKKHRKCIKSN